MPAPLFLHFRSLLFTILRIFCGYKNSKGESYLIIILVFFLFFSGCQIKSTLLKPALFEEETEKGEVFLYTQPFPQEADRLRFNIEEISAVKDDGMVFPLSISLHEFKSREMKRQRLIALGKLPEGNYTGLSFKVRNASLKVEDGEAALLAPQEPVKIDFSFNLNK